MVSDQPTKSAYAFDFNRAFPPFILFIRVHTCPEASPADEPAETAAPEVMLQKFCKINPA